MLVQDALGSGDAIQNRHLDVHDAQVDHVLVSEPHGLLTIGGLGDDLVTGVGEGLDDIQADQGLVLGDQDPAGAGRT